MSLKKSVYYSTFNIFCWVNFICFYFFFVNYSIFYPSENFFKEAFFYLYTLLPLKMNLWHLSWSITFPNPASLGLESIHIFHNDIWLILGTIFCTVMYIGMEAIIRFGIKNRTKISKNVKLIEFIWTILPILLVVIMLIPSLSLSLILNNSPTSTDIDELPMLSLNVIGNQWFWQYEMDIQDLIEYLDIHPKFLKKYSNIFSEPLKIDAYMLPMEDLNFGELRGLTTTQKLILPLGVEIKLNGNSRDVLHSWAVNGFDIKMDVVPGRINQQSFQILVPGKFYGQCSELCGVDHGFMPISIEVIPMPDFADWLSKILEQRLNSYEVIGIKRFCNN